MQEASVKLKIDGDCSSFSAAAAQAESAGRSSAASIAAAYSRTSVAASARFAVPHEPLRRFPPGT